MRHPENVVPFAARSRPAAARPALSVVVPVLDEEDNVCAVAVDVAEALDTRPGGFELIFVDDGSRDGTAATVERIAARDPRVRLLRHERRMGQSAAVRSGVKAARAPMIAVLDGDGQNDPRDLPEMLERFDELDAASATGAGMVIGHRVRRRDRWTKRAASRVANAVRRLVLRDGVPDSGCGIKVFRRASFLELPTIDSLHRFLPALFRAGGYAVRSIPVRHRERLSGRSKYGILDRLLPGVVDLAGVAWLSRRRVPRARRAATKRDGAAAPRAGT